MTPRNSTPRPRIVGYVAGQHGPFFRVNAERYTDGFSVVHPEPGFVTTVLLTANRIGRAALGEVVALEYYATATSGVWRRVRSRKNEQPTIA